MYRPPRRHRFDSASSTPGVPRVMETVVALLHDDYVNDYLLFESVGEGSQGEVMLVFNAENDVLAMKVVAGLKRPEILLPPSRQQQQQQQQRRRTSTGAGDTNSSTTGNSAAAAEASAIFYFSPRYQVLSARPRRSSADPFQNFALLPPGGTGDSIGAELSASQRGLLQMTFVQTPTAAFFDPDPFTQFITDPIDDGAALGAMWPPNAAAAAGCDDGDTAAVAVPMMTRPRPSSKIPSTPTTTGLAGRSSVGRTALQHPQSTEMSGERVVNKAVAKYNALIREVRILSRCCHRNIVRLVEVIDDPASTTVYLVMEYLDGGPLASMVIGKPTRVYPPDDLAPMARQLCAALHYLHQRGIVHRDIKPDNILRTKDGTRVLFCDFGVSDAIDTDELLRNPSAPLLISGLRGTRPFLAPEQHRETSRYVDGRAVDVFALGLTLRTVLYGDLPWSLHEKSLGEYAVKMADLNEPVPLPEELPDGTPLPAPWRRLLEGMLHKDPAQRATLPEIRAQLHAMTTASSSSASSQVDDGGLSSEGGSAPVTPTLSSSASHAHNGGTGAASDRAVHDEAAATQQAEEVLEAELWSGAASSVLRRRARSAAVPSLFLVGGGDVAAETGPSHDDTDLPDPKAGTLVLLPPEGEGGSRPVTPCSNRLPPSFHREAAEEAANQIRTGDNHSRDGHDVEVATLRGSPALSLLQLRRRAGTRNGGDEEEIEDDPAAATLPPSSVSSPPPEPAVVTRMASGTVHRLTSIDDSVVVAVPHEDGGGVISAPGTPSVVAKTNLLRFMRDVD